MGNINIGIIGCGVRMDSILENLSGLGEHVFVKAIYDPSQKSINNIVSKYNINAQIYDDYRELVKSSLLDWIFIGSINRFHCEQVVAAAEANKNIFCEKPLAINFEDCRTINKAVKKAGVKFIVGFTLRYSPHYNTIIKLIKDGKIGDIISMEFNETLDFNHGGFIMGDWRRLRKNAGPHVLEKCCHDLDLANWFIGSKASKVASFGGLDFYLPENNKYIEQIGKDKKGRPAYRTWCPDTGLNPFTSDKDIIDNQVAIIEYANGVRATFHSNCNAGIPERRMYILGTEGAIRADLMGGGKIEYKQIGFDKKIENIAPDIQGEHGGGDQVLGKEIFNVMLDKKDPKSTLEDGVIAAVTALGIDRAMKTGNIVDMEEYWEKMER